MEKHFRNLVDDTYIANNIHIALIWLFALLAGEEWMKLPHTTPKEIFATRSINKFFTGRLDAKVSNGIFTFHSFHTSTP